jgi:hypothetical protein
MFKKPHKINILLLIVIFFYACNTARRVPQGKALLQENYVDGVKREMAEILEEQIRQQPNRRILSSYKFFLGVYNTFDTTYKKNKLRRRLIRIGEEPVIYDSTMNHLSVINIKQALFNMGYYDAEVTWKDTLVGKKRNYAKVYYGVKLNKSYIISKVDYYVGDRYLDSLVHAEVANSYIKVNHVFNKSDFDAERNRITTQLRNLGYYYFNKEYIYYQLDSLVDSLQIKVKVMIENPPNFSEHQVYRISDVYINIENPANFRKRDTVYHYYKDYYIRRNGYNVARDVLLTKIFIYKGDLYRQRSTTATYDHLNDLQLFRFVNIVYAVDTSRWVRKTIHDEYRGDYEFFGDTTGSPPSLICYINMAPTNKYEFVIEPQGIISDPISIAANRNINYGGAISVLLANKNILTKAETFQLKANGALAYQFNTPGTIFEKELAYKQLGLEAQLKVPKFVLPWDFKFVDARNSNTTYNLNYSAEGFQEFKRDVFAVSNRYQTTLFRSLILNFSPIDISFIQSRITDLEFRRRIEANTLTKIQFQPKFIVSIRAFALYNSKRTIFNMPQFSGRIGLESSGFLLNALSKTLNADYNTSIKAYELFGVPYSQFVRGDVDLRYTIKVFGLKSVAFRFYGGVVLPRANSAYTGVPFEKRFFVGGTNDLRGWRIRRIGPGSFYYDDTSDFYRAGDVKLMVNGEYRTLLYKAFSGAVFFDAGNVWNIKPEAGKPGAEFNPFLFYKQIALDVGLGLRYDFDFFVLRLDAAMPVFDPRNLPDGSSKWVMKRIHSFKDFNRNINLNVAIGLPF